MKNIFCLSLTAILFIFASCMNITSNEPKQENPGMPHVENAPKVHNVPKDAGKMSREEQIQQIKMQKIAFMTEQLDLTVEESQMFWPVYNKWWEVKMALIRKQNELYKSIGQKDAASLEDVEQLALLCDEESELIRTWSKEFAKVLPASKVAKVFVVEERFKNHLIKNFGGWRR